MYIFIKIYVKKYKDKYKKYMYINTYLCIKQFLNLSQNNLHIKERKN